MASHSNDEMFKLLIEQQREAATKAVQEAAAKAAKAGQRYKDRDTNNAGENLISSISKMSCAGDAAAGNGSGQSPGLSAEPTMPSSAAFRDIGLFAKKKTGKGAAGTPVVNQAGGSGQPDGQIKGLDAQGGSGAAALEDEDAEMNVDDLSPEAREAYEARVAEREKQAQEKERKRQEKVAKAPPALRNV